MDQVYEVWIEIQANKKLISDSVKFREAMEKCKKAGMTVERKQASTDSPVIQP